MSWRLFSFGIALAAVFTAYQRADFAIPLSTHDAALSLRDFWHRTFMQYAFWQPYVLSERSHVVQHPPPTDALSPAQAKAARDAELKKKSYKPERMPVYFISHGTPDALMLPHDSLPYQSWQSVGRQIADLNPTAIVAVSSRWEGQDNDVYVTSGDAENELLYDFKDYPDAYYKQAFSSYGSSAVAAKVVDALKASQIRISTKQRGIDSGLWVPLKAMFNGTTSIPLVQLSLFDTGNAKQAIKLGSALRSLRHERILLLGSGMTVFNPKEAAKYDASKPAFWVSSYDEAVQKMLVDNTGSDREVKAGQITFRPEYRRAHPTPEALFALYFAVGAAGDDEAEMLFSMHEGSMAWASVRFGETSQVM